MTTSRKPGTNPWTGKNNALIGAYNRGWQARLDGDIAYAPYRNKGFGPVCKKAWLRGWYDCDAMLSTQERIPLDEG